MRVLPRSELEMETAVSKKRFALIAATILAAAAVAPAQAGSFTNGGFETNTATSSGSKINGDLAGWTNNDWYSNGVDKGPGYNFLYLSNPNNVYNTGLPLWGVIPPSPNGGNFVGMDGAYEQSPLSQTVTGLTAGALYYISFYFGGAQQDGPSFTSATTDQFAVDFTSGSTAPVSYTCTTTGVQCTQVLYDAPKSFTGWNFAGFTFLATSSTETLSFLAIGTPAGQPPFSLLDGVSLQLPEPPSVLMLGGLGVLLAAARVRRKRAA